MKFLIFIFSISMTTVYGNSCDYEYLECMGLDHPGATPKKAKEDCEADLKSCKDSETKKITNIAEQLKAEYEKVKGDQFTAKEECSDPHGYKGTISIEEELACITAYNNN